MLIIPIWGKREFYLTEENQNERDRIEFEAYLSWFWTSGFWFWNFAEIVLPYALKITRHELYGVENIPLEKPSLPKGCNALV